MRACPCCLEPLVPAASGRRGRQLAGPCEVCATPVCADCLRRQGPRPERRVCLSCLWDIMSRRGYRPSFPEPPGRRRPPPRAETPPACGHARAGGWMGFCPDCGEELPWTCAPGNPSCAVCAAPSHEGFNFCWACGESFEEDNPQRPEAEGYRLAWPCSEGCGGGVDWLMPFCPWCGELQAWHFADEAGETHACPGCESSVDAAWAHCVFCGTATAAASPQAATPTSPPEEDEDEEEAPADAPRAPPRVDAEDEEEDEEEAPRPAPEPEPSGDEEEEESPPEAPPRREDSPWQVLGVAPGTPLPEVRRAWLSLVTQYHPDKVAQLGPKLQALAQEETRRLNAAWERIRQGAR